MSKSRAILLTITVLIALTLSCSFFADNSNSSPAPGCNKSFGMGGCFGKTAILDLSVEPLFDCLRIEQNNCNGGVLEVRNSCQETLVIGDVVIYPSEYATFDVVEDENGNYSLREVDSNFSDFIPEENRLITASGMLGSQKIKVSFFKTANLCE